MPSLRDYRDRIKSVKSTKKITAAMKMVAASKLRKAQEQAEHSHPYSQSMSQALARLTDNITITNESSPLLKGTGSDQTHLVVVVSSDRGLCGGFNATILKDARRKLHQLKEAGKDVKIVCIGRKAYDSLRTDFKSLIIKSFLDITSKKRMEYSDAQDIRDYIVSEFDAGSFDVCTLIYNDFKSIMVQEPTRLQLIPLDMDSMPDASAAQPVNEHAKNAPETHDEHVHLAAPYAFEPDEESIVNTLLPRNIGVQIFRAMLDSAAGEQASRMTAMDNATRNAGDMINNLTLQYNRARQAYITKELIEIISGAEAV